MSDKTAKTRKKLLTTFDIILIAAVVVIAALFLIWKASSGGGGPILSANTGTVRFTLELTGMRGDSAALIAAGDNVVESTKKTAVGRVVSAEISDTEYLGEDLEHGGKVLSTRSDLKTALVVIETDCTITDSAISTTSGAIELRVGSFMGLRGPGYFGGGYIVAVERN